MNIGSVSNLSELSQQLTSKSSCFGVIGCRNDIDSMTLISDLTKNKSDKQVAYLEYDKSFLNILKSIGATDLPIVIELNESNSSKGITLDIVFQGKSDNYIKSLEDMGVEF